MLRTLFVLAIAAFGGFHAIRGPFYALLLYLWVAYFRPESWVWGGIAATWNLSFIVGAFLVLSTIVRGTSFRFDIRSLVLGALLAQSLVSTLASDNFAYCWPFFQEFVKTAVIAYLLACLVTDVAKFRLTLMVIAASLGFELVKQGWLQLLLSPGAKSYSTHPALGDENGVALGVLMLVPILAVLAKTASSKWQKWTFAAAMVGAIYRAISTYSRGAFVASGALAMMVFLRSKHKVRAAVAVAAVSAVILPVLPDAFWERMQTIAVSEDALAEGDNSSRGRLHFWRVAVLMAQDRPLTGVGHNGFSASYNRYDFTFGEFGEDRAVHSSWFGVLAELGYPGAALYGVSLLMAFVACWRVRRTVTAGAAAQELRDYASAVETSLVVFVVGGSFLSFQYIEMVWHLVGLSAALHAIAHKAAAVEIEDAEIAKGVAGWQKGYRWAR